jgi:hypothetical protein
MAEAKLKHSCFHAPVRFIFGARSLRFDRLFFLFGGRSYLTPVKNRIFAGSFG